MVEHYESHRLDHVVLLEGGHVHLAMSWSFCGQEKLR